MDSPPLSVSSRQPMKRAKHLVDRQNWWRMHGEGKTASRPKTVTGTRIVSLPSIMFVVCDAYISKLVEERHLYRAVVGSWTDRLPSSSSHIFSSTTILLAVSGEPVYLWQFGTRADLATSAQFEKIQNCKHYEHLKNRFPYCFIREVYLLETNH
jgi:hypothetical protein